jgi:predicted HNH restriction endonuclease
MSQLIWNEEQLMRLGNDFLNQVLVNMTDDNSSVVRLGATGKGIRPNYQITYSNGSSVAFSGINHKPDSRSSIFDETKISEPFTYESISELLNYIRNEVNQSILKPVYKENYNGSIFPEEIQNDQKCYEGSTKKIIVNIYERNPLAKHKCIKHYGINCYVCGFNFEKKYGETGRGFIHVHHLKPLSEIGEKYELNPIQDLRPVCPNCHAMLHRRKPPYSIEELKQIINTSYLLIQS